MIGAPNHLPSRTVAASYLTLDMASPTYIHVLRKHDRAANVTPRHVIAIAGMVIDVPSSVAALQARC